MVDQGTGGRVSSLGYDIAGKTGTAGVGDEIRSAWFVAYTKQVSTAVMFVAGEGGSGDLDPYKRPGDGTFFGGTYPAMLWADVMKVAMDGLKNEPFPEPAYVNNGRTPSPTATVTTTTPTATPTNTPTPTATTTTTTSVPTAPATSATTTTAPPEPSVSVTTSAPPGGGKPSASKPGGPPTPSSS